MHNDIEKVSRLIENIIDDVCNYNLNNMFSNIDLLILEISNCIELKEMPKDRVDIFNNILENINIALQNEDYQLVSDILQFQLKNFMKNI